MSGSEPFQEKDEPDSPTASAETAGISKINDNVTTTTTHASQKNPASIPKVIHPDAEKEGERRDDFGLPIKSKPQRAIQYESGSDSESDFKDAETGKGTEFGEQSVAQGKDQHSNDSHTQNSTAIDGRKELPPKSNHPESKESPRGDDETPVSDNDLPGDRLASNDSGQSNTTKIDERKDPRLDSSPPESEGSTENKEKQNGHAGEDKSKADEVSPGGVEALFSGQTGAVSGWSHQALATQKVETNKEEEEDEWKEMPAFAPYDLYDDDGKLIAREAHESDEEVNAYAGLGGAGKGYTRVQLEEDAKSTTSMEENTDYLFKPVGTEVHDENEDQRDPLAQLKATKDLLTEGQRIAYVGVTRLTLAKMLKSMDELEGTKKTKKGKALAIENAKMWSQKMMVRLYLHMEISSSEQIMIEQLAEHGVEPEDLTPALMANARVKNPMADESETKDSKTEDTKKQTASNNTEKVDSSLKSPKLNGERRPSATSSTSREAREDSDEDPVPPYQEHEEHPLSEEVKSPEELGTEEKNIDIDIRWTVLCDLFLVLLADSVYDSRSRTLLEKVGEALKVSWVDICRFEKRVTDSLEMREGANKETWDENEHIDTRRKQALRRRYIVMGLATVGGGLVIGLSAGALAPVIGAGLAAGFSTIGVAGTGGFLAGAGGTAIITTGAAVAGSSMGIRASNRRTGAVKTFEYRPLHNNKRVNLIVTISGWMNGKVDDVRLPFSTVDPVMGDMYSVLWEPEMLSSMGETISILASEALSQTIQQVLGSTVLITLMGALQLPIVLSKLTYLIDNPWTVSMGRANAAGLIFADSLIDRNLGARPITLVGFSLGARVIFAALRELAARGAYGLIENVYLFGSPIVANKDEYLRARAMVSGRFVNGYASNDWILGYLFRATSGGISRVAGLAPVQGVAGVENINVTSVVNGHMAYRAAMPKLLRMVEWEVESDEFTEIEDPDPENHERRQRELIKEIDEARKEAEKKPEKRRFGIFKRGKMAEKKGWEIYDDRNKVEDDFSTAAAEGANANVLFDIEAIKKELASEQIEVKELKSTAPPMKITIDDFQKSEDERPPPLNPHATLRETKSDDGLSNPPFPARSSSFNQTLESAVDKKMGKSQDRNPFDQGYDEYNLSAEAVNGRRGSDYGKMSFDTTTENSPHVHQSPRFSADSHFSPPPTVPAGARTPSPHRPPERPSLTSSNTLPNGTVSLPTAAGAAPPFDHNAWADEEDEDFGKEKEVTMSFA